LVARFEIGKAKASNSVDDLFPDPKLKGWTAMSMRSVRMSGKVPERRLAVGFGRSHEKGPPN
jgi:hypothetical protein